ncbi:MAG: hypothetical protein ACPGJV_10410 [Bacteriovoracaceae bacterium]
MKLKSLSFRKCFLTLLPFLFLISFHVDAKVSKGHRQLVVVSELKTFGQSNLSWLYSFLDASTVTVAVAKMSHAYRSIKIIKGSKATKTRFVNVLNRYSKRNAISAIDVILSLHGLSNELYFADGAVSTFDLRDDLKDNPKKYKYRLMYNLACYGSSHRNEFRASGFKTVVGARRVNANSAFEYPFFLTHYGLGTMNVKTIIGFTNMHPSKLSYDFMAKTVGGFSDADSHKKISGVQNLKINSNAF